MNQRNQLTMVLAAIVATFCGVLIAQYAGLGSGYSFLSDNGEGKKPRSFDSIDKTPFNSQQWEVYAELLTRPVFHDSRRPEAIEEGEGALAENEVPVAPLNATLTGVIITPQLQLAMLKDNNSSISMRVKMGMPLEGELAGWKLVELHPRAAVFENPSQARQELMLNVSDKPGQVQAVNSVVNKPDPNAPATNAAADAAPTADEIRLRIEERRRQLREEAQRMAQSPEQKEQ